jgi:antitoxin component HigA of HigAB toxin-antitoxin module
LDKTTIIQNHHEPKMNSDVRHDKSEVPDELKELFEKARPVEEVMAELKSAPLDLEHDPEFWGERLKADIVEEILVAMKQQGLNKNQLAARLGKSRQWVTRVLNEGNNFTAETVAKIACALGKRPSIRFEKTR